MSSPSPTASEDGAADNNATTLNGGDVDNGDKSSKSGAASTNKNKRTMLIGATAIILIIGAVLGIYFGVTAGNANASPDASSTSNEGEATTPNMTAIVTAFKSNLPSSTIQSLLNASSPQAQAYEWATSPDQPPLYGFDPVARMTQRFALATLYYATKGATKWKDSQYWLNMSFHECKWLGCSCTTEKAIETVDLRSNSLSGPLPRELGLLSTLTALTLESNNLIGTIPSELGMMSDLESLSFYDNKLQGSIPKEQFQTALMSLDLSQNELGGTIPTEIGQATGLQFLYLYTNALKGSIPTEIGLTKLDQVDMEGNKLTGTVPTEIGLLSPSLKGFYAGTNQLSGPIPSEIGQCTLLTQLYLRDNYFSGELPPELGSLTMLNEFYVSYNGLTGEIPTELGKLSNLESCELYSNAINGTLPSQLCGLVDQDSLQIEVDCAAVVCNCACKCSENATADDAYYYDDGE